MTLPYIHQRNAVRECYRLGGRSLVCGDPGTGKSLVGLLTADKLAAFPTIIVCFASLKWNWLNEVSMHLGMRAEILETTKPPDLSPLTPKSPLLIINYDILKAWLPHLKALEPKMIILDESQACSSRSSIRSKACIELCQGVPHVLALSGTPLLNRPAELFTTLHILKPSVYRNFWPFAKKWCAPKRTPWGWDVSGASNLDQLHQELARHVLVRFRKSEVLSSIPDKQRAVIILPLADRTDYDSAQKDFIAWLKRTGQGNVKKAEKAKKLVQLSYLKQEAAGQKLPAVFTWIDDYLRNTPDKLVLFGIHKATIEAITQKYAKRCVKVDGSVVGIDRQLAFTKFNTDKKCRIFVGNIKAGGCGWNAKGASTVAFVEYPWSPGAVLQAEDRAHGISRGVEGKITQIVFLVAKDTVEERLVKIIQSKQNVIGDVIDGVGKGEKLQVFDMLCQALLEENFV